ncbi:MAG: hypothetical protein Q4E53_13675 [Eubacteriales bacterium]|nr:hypothetical protein [Eubacteriales bacterium]
MKKRVGLFLALVLILSMAATGCSKKASPKSAADILKINEDEKNNSYSMEGSVHMEMGMEAMGLTFDIPITMDMKMDVADKNAHGTMDLTMDMGALGGENTLSSELYMEKTENEIVVYSKTNEDSKWSKEGSDSEQMVSMGTSILEGANFDNADFKHDEEAKTYIVTQKFSDLMASGNMEDYFGTLFETFGAMGIDEDSAKEMMDGMGNTDVVYTFDEEECHLQSAKIENMEYSLKTETGGMEMTIKATMSMDFNYSNHGQIKAEDVAVPDEVKAEAE